MYEGILPSTSILGKLRRQMDQLRELDPASYKEVLFLLDSGRLEEASEAVRQGMQDAFTSLTSPPSQEKISEVIEAKQQWHSGESLLLWENGKKSLHIKNERGFLYLLSVVEGKCLMDRQSTQRQVGYLHPALGQWIALHEEV